MLSLTIIVSSSAGNCTLVATETTKILVDVGIPFTELQRRLAAEGHAIEDLSAILVTHSHVDHTRAVQQIATSTRVPMYLTKGTENQIIWGGKPETSHRNSLIKFGRMIEDETFTIGDISGCAFAIPHDDHQPVGYRLWSGDSFAAIATDLGHITESVASNLVGVGTLLLEANHDPAMLAAGAYPKTLKDRISGPLGHLSNEEACDFVRDHLDNRTTNLILGHLSESNNDPRLVSALAKKAMRGRSTAFHIATPGLTVTI